MSVVVNLRTSEIEIIKYGSKNEVYIEKFHLAIAIKDAILAYDAACPNHERSLKENILKLLGET
jgi:nitrite reductase/ring-hydroxylating ferredoxin subunit